jgi:nicotinate phosphoribosyltransferase
MMQAVYHFFTTAWVKYAFKCRNADNLKIKLTDAVSPDEIMAEIDHLCTLRFTEKELEYLSGLRFIKPDFIEFLRIFQMQKAGVSVVKSGNDYEIIVAGGWLHKILYEIYILYIVNELYFRNTVGDICHPDHPNGIIGRQNLNNKTNLADTYAWNLPSNRPFNVSDFGTRRRFSGAWQDSVVKHLKEYKWFKGTSNVHLAMKYNLTPIGTMAHEWLMAMQAFGRVDDSQRLGFQVWANEYRGDLGIALSDVVGLDAFLCDFDMYFAKLFDGPRHDSGDPYEWTRRIIAHYHKLKINPRAKTAVYSDGLTMASAIDLHKNFSEMITMAFGIGTFFSNDVGVEPLQIVMKMIECNGQPVAKKSDSAGKGMCRDDEYAKYVSRAFAAKIARSMA